MVFTSLPSHSRLVELLAYDALTGVFTWKLDRANTAKAGGKAGGVITSGKYVDIRVDGKAYKAHRLAWLYVTGDDPGTATVDHIDCNGLNNAFANLRLATRRQQRFNWGGRKDVGIEYDKRRPNKPWLARFDGKRYGCYATRDEARAAYLKAYNEGAEGFANKKR